MVVVAPGELAMTLGLLNSEVRLLEFSTLSDFVIIFRRKYEV